MSKDSSFSVDLFFSYSFDLLAVVGTDGYFKHINPAFETVLGYTKEELLSKPIVDFLHPDDVQKTKKGIQTLTSGTATIESKNRYLCKDGNYKWFSWNTNTLGSLFYTIGRDITQQIRNEEAIQRLNTELGKKNEDLEIKIQQRVKELQRSEAQIQQLQKMDAIGRLAGGIAHDFNNMLAAITLYCDLLEDKIDPKSVHDCVKSIQKTTDRAAALTRQLLVFSRKQIIQLQTINLNPLIHQLEKMLARLIGENIKIVMNLAEDLKPVNVDPSQIEQVILNLVVNARDAMPKGGVITIETSNIFLDEKFSHTHLSVERGHYIQLSVTDEGLGMDAETISKIFEPFFTTKPIGKGTGLGLTTIYGIVKQCKGTIWVYSEPNKGSVFKVYLPLSKKLAVTEEEHSVQISEVVGVQTILLVEDDENLRTGFSVMLQKKGYHVLEASSGKDALEICEKYKDPIHLLLTDVVMPDFSGFELAKKALALRGNLKVLYMSGYTNEALENAGKEKLENVEFIQKPFSTNILIAKVQKILSVDV